MEAAKRGCLELFLKMALLYNLKIKGYSHRFHNIPRRMVKSSELAVCTLEGIKNNLKDPKVLEVKRISIKKKEKKLNYRNQHLEYDIQYLETPTQNQNYLHNHECSYIQWGEANIWSHTHF